MKTPIELLKQELTILKYMAFGRLNPEIKRKAKRLIPLYESAIELLEKIKSAS